jgi:hypothetical protein
MAENGKYLIGESLREKLKSTIAKVDALSPGAPVTRIQTVGQGMPAYTPKIFRVCTFTGTWSVDTDKTLKFRNVTTTPNTVSARNIFADIKGGTSSACITNCAIAKDGTAWYLIAAGCQCG